MITQSMSVSQINYMPNTNMPKIYDVMCIDTLGVGSWESVEYSHTDSKNNLHGFIARTGKMVKFWEDEDNDFLGTTYDKNT